MVLNCGLYFAISLFFKINMNKAFLLGFSMNENKIAMNVMECFVWHLYRERIVLLDVYHTRC